MMASGLKLPVFFKPDDAIELTDDLEEDRPLRDYDVRTAIFYNIDAITPYFDENDDLKEYSTIHCSGGSFVCTMTIDEVEDEIKAHMKKLMVFTIS